MCKCIVKGCVSNQMGGADLAGLDNIKDAVMQYRTDMDLDITFPGGFGIGTVFANKKGRIGIVVAVEISVSGIKVSFVYGDDIEKVLYKVVDNLDALFSKYKVLGCAECFDFTSAATQQKRSQLQAQLADLQAQIANLR